MTRRWFSRLDHQDFSVVDAGTLDLSDGVWWPVDPGSPEWDGVGAAPGRYRLLLALREASVVAAVVCLTDEPPATWSPVGTQCLCRTGLLWLTGQTSTAPEVLAERVAAALPRLDRDGDEDPVDLVTEALGQDVPEGVPAAFAAGWERYPEGLWIIWGGHEGPGVTPGHDPEGRTTALLLW
ncbi:hypothetical protein ACMA1D_27660 [Streptomyces sp. 796.1]|uniref:hypothetical protein n=1 Tax=Streptomyces sp. 796.1 TaxID=3163029 RepID=UPI0039C97AE9